MLRRNEACLKSLRGFDEAAEAEDERGRGGFATHTYFNCV